MFSRIFASDSDAVPASHSGLLARAQQQRARRQHQPAVEPDRGADVARVALAEIRVHLARGSRRTRVPAARSARPSERASGLSAPRRRRAGCQSGRLTVRPAAVRLHRRHVRSFARRGLQVDLDRALGRVDARLHDLARLAVNAARAQVAHAPARSRPTQLWQMPMRQPCGSVAPARSPAARIGSSPSLRDSHAAGAEADRAARPRARRRRPRRPAGSARGAAARARPRAPSSSLIARSRPAGPHRNASRSRQSAHSALELRRRQAPAARP